MLVAIELGGETIGFVWPSWSTRRIDRPEP